MSAAPSPRLSFAAWPPLLLSAAFSLAVPGHFPAWAAAFAVTLVLRAWMDGTGRVGMDAQSRVALWSLLPVVAAVWIGFAHASGGPTWGRTLAIVPMAQILVVLGPMSGIATALLLALAGVQVVACALLVPAAWTSGAAVLWAASLVPAALRVEWSAFEASALSKEAGVKRVRAPVPAGAARHGLARGLVRTTLVLLAAGLPLGLLLFAALPASPSRSRHDVRSSPEPFRGGGGGWPVSSSPEEPRDLPAGGTAEREMPLRRDTKEVVSGVRKSLSLGLVSSVKKDPTPVLLVKVGAGERGPEPLTIRATAYDLWTGREWRRSLAAQGIVARPTGEPGSSGWLPVGPSAGSGPLWRLRITDLLGKGQGMLFLMPDAESVRLETGRSRAGIAVARDGSVSTPQALDAGESYFEQARETVHDRALLLGLASDASVAPMREVMAVPTDADVFLALAKEAIEGATDASVRAARIEAWLRSRNAYSLDVRGPPPSLADFVRRRLPGTCEYFASAMVLAMRALGHPARLAIGFRGGDFLEATSREWSFRASHAHAWCEVFFEGAGWAVFDPTPSGTGEGGGNGGGAGAEGDEGSADPTFWQRLARWGPEDRRWARERLQAVARGVTDGDPIPLAVVIGLGALVLVAILRSARRRHAAAALAPGGPSSGGPPLWPPYARALSALSGVGLSRDGTETASEHLDRAGASLPPASAPLTLVTRLYEAFRFGGRAVSGDDEKVALSRAEDVERIAADRRKTT